MTASPFRMTSYSDVELLVRDSPILSRGPRGIYKMGSTLRTDRASVRCEMQRHITSASADKHGYPVEQFLGFSLFLGRPIFFFGLGFNAVKSGVSLTSAGLSTEWSFTWRSDSVFGEFAIIGSSHQIAQGTDARRARRKYV